MIMLLCLVCRKNRICLLIKLSCISNRLLIKRFIIKLMLILNLSLSNFLPLIQNRKSFFINQKTKNIKPPYKPITDGNKAKNNQGLQIRNSNLSGIKKIIKQLIIQPLIKEKAYKNIQMHKLYKFDYIQMYRLYQEYQRKIKGLMRQGYSLKQIQNLYLQHKNKKHVVEASYTKIGNTKKPIKIRQPQAQAFKVNLDEEIQYQLIVSIPQKQRPINQNKNIVLLQNDNEEKPLFQCREGCGRKFNQKALIKHQRNCKKVFQQKRNAFDIQKKRIIQDSHKIEKVQHVKTNWKQKSQCLRSGLKGKLVQSLIGCQTCGRKFNQTAAARHIPFCKAKFKLKR